MAIVPGSINTGYSSQGGSQLPGSYQDPTTGVWLSPEQQNSLRTGGSAAGAPGLAAGRIHADATTGQQTPPAYAGSPVQTNYGPNGNDPSYVNGIGGQQQPQGAFAQGLMGGQQGLNGVHGVGASGSGPGGFPQLPTGDPYDPNSQQGRFLPQILTSPFVDGMSAINNALGWQSAALPGASGYAQALYGPYGYANLLGQLGGAGVQGANQFEQGIYNQGLNPLEAGLFETGSRLGTQQLNHASNLGQLQLDEAARLGRRTMADTFNRIDSQYENTPMASSRAPQYDEAANLFSQNLMGAGNQLGENIINAGQQFGLGSVQQALQAGLQRQGLGAQLAGNRQNIGASLAQEGIRNMGSIFNSPYQAVNAQQQGASGLLGLAQQGMYGMLNPALGIVGSIPTQAPTYVQGGGGGGGKK